MLASRILHLVTQYAATFQTFVGGNNIGGSQGEVQDAAYTLLPDFAFSEDWQVLGPFQIGTREAAWGADPLELFGGFRALEYDHSMTFKSSLAFNGTTNWSNVTATLSRPDKDLVSAGLSISFSDVDWESLQEVYGWAAVQWQGWARGEISIRSEGTKTLAFNAKQVLEFWIDGEHYFGGDFYGFERAPVTLHLEPGVHRIDVRLVRDVRSMGGVGIPGLEIKLELRSTSEDLVGHGNVLIAEVLGDFRGPLNSPYASVIVRNDARADVFVTRVEGFHNWCETELFSPEPIKLIPGQARPIAFEIACIPPITGRGPIPIDFYYRVDGAGEEKKITFNAWPQDRGLYEPQKITYMHPGGVVSYAVLRPPSANADCANNGNENLPILLQLHGAGVEADSDIVRHSLDPLPDLCAWVLFPTGVTPWSGDDWHQWGFADVEAAVAAIPAWIARNEWKQPGVDVDRWLVSGHSNGGQGTWYTVTHRPDKVIAAAPLSGYSSIQNYVPYTFWHPADPGRTAVVQSALNSYRHELLLENVKDIPIFIQHGSADDNVPAYHSRLMSQQIQEASSDSNFTEIPSKPHYWDGVLTTSALADFYKEHLNKLAAPKIPSNMADFTIVSANIGDMETKNGIGILELATPGQLGKIHFSLDPVAMGCVLRTSNVKWIRVPLIFSRCVIDGRPPLAEALWENWQAHESMDLMLREGEWTPAKWVERAEEIPTEEKNHRWAPGSSPFFPPLPPRQGNQLGSLDSILRTRGVLSIVYHSEAAKKIALQISRNLLQYFAADSIITSDYEKAKNQIGTNLISIAIGPDLPEGLSAYHHAIEIVGESIRIIDIHSVRSYESSNGLAAIFLRPAVGRRLELVVWGVDEASLGIAARLVPLMSGTGQPDFVIADKSMLLKGVEGALALGLLDSLWNVTRNSYVS